MIGYFVIALLMTADPVVVESRLLRQDRQDSIYVVRGGIQALKAFHKEHGKSWTGGAVIDEDPSDGILRYWAYSDRTASQSRALMMPAIFSGLDLGVEEYRESVRFPVERNALDKLAEKCGAKNDPYFLTPKRAVELTLSKAANPSLEICLRDGVERKIRLPLQIANKSKDSE